MSLNLTDQALTGPTSGSCTALERSNTAPCDVEIGTHHGRKHPTTTSDRNVIFKTRYCSRQTHTAL